MKSGDDEIISATQTELAFFLVMVFVLALGWQLDNGDKALPGKEVGTIPVANAKGGPAGASRNDIGGPTNKLGVGVGDALTVEHLRRCGLSLSENRWTWHIEKPRAARTPDELAASRGEWTTSVNYGENDGLVFRVREWTITEHGRRCLDDICPRLVATYREQSKDLAYVLIKGFASSEWSQMKGCPPDVPHPKSPADAARAAYRCNLIVSERRAAAVYDYCRAINSAEPQITDEEFAKRFFPHGWGPLNPLHDANGHENKTESRRVEFDFVRAGSITTASPR